MIFALIVLVLVGGFILLLPLSQRLGKLLDVWVNEQKSLSARADPDATQQALSDLSQRLKTLEEQQDFLEKLVRARELPAGSEVEEP